MLRGGVVDGCRRRIRGVVSHLQSWLSPRIRPPDVDATIRIAGASAAGFHGRLAGKSFLLGRHGHSGEKSEPVTAVDTPIDLGDHDGGDITWLSLFGAMPRGLSPFFWPMRSAFTAGLSRGLERRRFRASGTPRRLVPRLRGIRVVGVSSRSPCAVLRGIRPACLARVDIPS